MKERYNYIIINRNWKEGFDKIHKLMLKGYKILSEDGSGNVTLLKLN